MAAIIGFINFILLLGFDPRIILWEKELKLYQKYYLYNLKG